VRSYSVSLNENESLPLVEELPTRFRCELRTVLLTGLVQRFHDGRGTANCCGKWNWMGARSNRRRNHHFARAIGCFSTMFPRPSSLSGQLKARMRSNRSGATGACVSSCYRAQMDLCRRCGRRLPIARDLVSLRQHTFESTNSGLFASGTRPLDRSRPAGLLRRHVLGLTVTVNRRGSSR